MIWAVMFALTARPIPWPPLFLSSLLPFVLLRLCLHSHLIVSIWILILKYCCFLPSFPTLTYHAHAAILHPLSSRQCLAWCNFLPAGTCAHPVFFFLGDNFARCILLSLIKKSWLEPTARSLSRTTFTLTGLTIALPGFPSCRSCMTGSRSTLQFLIWILCGDSLKRRTVAGGWLFSSLMPSISYKSNTAKQNICNYWAWTCILFFFSVLTCSMHTGCDVVICKGNSDKDVLKR